MPKQPGFKPIPDAKRGFMVSIPADMNGAGTGRKRKFFKELKEAEKYAATLRGQYARGERAGIVDASLARMAAEAVKVAPSGITILECAKAMAEMVALLAPFGISPLDACNAALAQHKATGTAESFRERYDRFVKDNETRWRDRYARDMLKIPRWVGEDFMSTPCAAVNPAVIEAALRANGADAATTVLARKTRVLAVIHAKAKKPKRGPIKIMTVTQCAAMLRACRNPAEVRAVALLLFAGVRPDAGDGELSKLDWQDVAPDFITVHPATSKTESDRYIPVTARLTRLLRGHPAEGTVVPANWKRRYTALRKAAGISRDLDIARHTFGSNYTVEFGVEAAKRAMGHTPDSETLFRSYFRAVKPAAAKRYFR